MSFVDESIRPYVELKLQRKSGQVVLDAIVASEDLSQDTWRRIQGETVDQVMDGLRSWVVRLTGSTARPCIVWALHTAATSLATHPHSLDAMREFEDSECISLALDLA